MWAQTRTWPATVSSRARKRRGGGPVRGGDCGQRPRGASANKAAADEEAGRPREGGSGRGGCHGCITARGTPLPRSSSRRRSWDAAAAAEMGAGSRAVVAATEAGEARPRYRRRRVRATPTGPAVEHDTSHSPVKFLTFLTPCMPSKYDSFLLLLLSVDQEDARSSCLDLKAPSLLDPAHNSLAHTSGTSCASCVKQSAK